VAPQLAASGTKLFLVSIGTVERSAEFAQVTGFPRDSLLADPDSVTYEALGLVKGVRQTFFGSEVSCRGFEACEKGGEVWMVHGQQQSLADQDPLPVLMRRGQEGTFALPDDLVTV
jgi:peroxiredoxin